MDNAFEGAAGPAVSVVVPVYNAERTLARCLDSVLAQELSDFECVLVDDGSSDNSAAICESYARNDRRFTVIQKANGGTGAARAAGVNAARGRTVTFLDNDDTLEPCALRCMHQAIKDDVKLVLASTRNLLPARGAAEPGEICRPWEAIGDHENPLCYLSESPRNRVHMMFVHGILIEKSLFERVITPVRGGNEDTFVLYQLFHQVRPRHIAVIPTAVYNYVVDSENSLLLSQLQRFNAGRIEDSPFANSRLIYDFLLREQAGDAALRCYMGNKTNGFLHVISVYLVLNQSRTGSAEITEFYHLYRRYRSAWQAAPYLAWVIPLCYHAPALGRIYRALIALANDMRVSLRRSRC